jgi:outer membrane receptor protein involved in Fe transport
MSRIACLHRMVSMAVVAVALVPALTVAQGSILADSRPTRVAPAEEMGRAVTVQLERVSLPQALRAVAASAGVQVYYRTELVNDATKLVTLHASKRSLGVVLEQVLAGTRLRAMVSTPGVIAIKLVPDERSSAKGTVTVRVTDASTKREIRGATVLLDDVARGTTNEDGRFQIPNVLAGNHVVAIRLLGYARQSRRIEVADDRTMTADFSLQMSTNTLDQVVVTGTVIPTERKAIPNAMTVITAKQIEERGITRIDQLFHGDVPGVFALNKGSNAPLDEVTMFSRGATAISYASKGVDETTGYITNTIKTYVDGIEMVDSRYLSQIDPKNIERIEILTGPQASTIYGSNAINGVMQIFTKRGTSPRPQLTLHLLSGLVENNFSGAKTPQHDYSAQSNGVQGSLSYNIGGTWNYTGPWTPAKQTARTSVFGGGRIALPAVLGQTTADVTFRRDHTQNQQNGNASQATTAYLETGRYDVLSPSGRSIPGTTQLTGQTFGLTLGFAPLSWWSYELMTGKDVSNLDYRTTGRGYQYLDDTTLAFQRYDTDRRSLRAVTTARIPATSFSHVTVTVGADAWQSSGASLSAYAQSLKAFVPSATYLSRSSDHNAGGFLQTQLEIHERIFLTYGVRVERNPAIGDRAQVAPGRYGIAYTQDFGPVSTKLRASYGRSIRPPRPIFKSGTMSTDSGVAGMYGDIYYQLPNPELVPEYQQGGEGGLELYWGTRGSLVVTRYNQTVDGLISLVSIADSVRSLSPNPLYYGYTCAEIMVYSIPYICSSQDADGYGYATQSEYLNIGSIRNQGWELQGSLNIGPFTTRGTYSWTKSRTIGITPKYRYLFPAQNYPQYQPGAMFQYLPEHTWATGVTYANAATRVGITMTGTGQLMSQRSDFSLRNLTGNLRLQSNRFRVSGSSGYVNLNPRYALTDLNASHRISSRVESILQVHNLMNRYANDFSRQYAAMGRQSSVGMRIRM